MIFTSILINIRINLIKCAREIFYVRQPGCLIIKSSLKGTMEWLKSKL